MTRKATGVDALPLIKECSLTSFMNSRMVTHGSSDFVAADDLATGKFVVCCSMNGNRFNPSIWTSARVIRRATVIRRPTSSDRCTLLLVPAWAQTLFGYLTAVSTELIKGNAQ